MIIYLATSGAYEERTVLHAFTTYADAEAHPGGDNVDEVYLLDHPLTTMSQRWTMNTTVKSLDAWSYWEYDAGQPQLEIDFQPNDTGHLRHLPAHIRVEGWRKIDVEDSYWHQVRKHRPDLMPEGCL